jgi:hypothetical protein
VVVDLTESISLNFLLYFIVIFLKLYNNGENGKKIKIKRNSTRIDSSFLVNIFEFDTFQKLASKYL